MNLKFLFTADGASGHRVPFHAHNATELVYFTEGFGTSTIRKILHRVSPCTFTLMDAGVFHDQKNETRLKSICVGIAGVDLSKYNAAWKDLPGAPVLECCKKLLAEVSSQKPHSKMIIKGLLMEIVGWMFRCFEGQDPLTGPRALVAKAKQAIAKENGKISVKKLSDILFISSDYLRHLFKEVTHDSPIQYILQIRMQNAQKLLSTTDLPVYEVAEKSGFTDCFHFSRMFKKATGFTPTQFRKKSA